MKNLDSLFSTYSLDSASMIRDLGAEKLTQMATAFGNEWSVNIFLPKLKEVNEQAKVGYLYRISALNSLYAIVPILNKEQFTINIAPMILKALKDPVPNVKFTALRLIKKVLKHVDIQIINKHFKQ